MNDQATAIQVMEQVEVTEPGGTVATVGTHTTVNSKEVKEKAHEDWDEQWKRERSGPHAKRARRSAKAFLRKIESHGYQGIAIIGVPNGVMRGSEFEAHLKNCGECAGADSDLCEEGCDALFEDDCHEHVFAFRSGDGYGLADQLLDDGSFRANDLVRDAEVVATEPAPEILDNTVLASGSGIAYTSEFWDAARALIDSPKKCEQCKQFLNLKTPPFVDVRLVLSGDGTPKPERLHLLCTRCHPDPKAKEQRSAA